MKVHELLSSPNRWTQKAWERNEKGKKVSHHNNYRRPIPGHSYCLSAAVSVCYGKNGETVRNKLITEIQKTARSYSMSFLTIWNDAPERKWEDVYNLCKELDI